MLILTNFKTYQTATGTKAADLAQIHAEVQQEFPQAKLAVAPQAVDLLRTAKILPTYAQHLDAADFGSFTGAKLAVAVKQTGAIGTLLNHSEKRFADREQLKQAAKQAQAAGLQVIICAESAEEGAAIMQEVEPDLIAVEPPELIGGDISVTTADPSLISRSVELIGAGKVLVGAGVKTGEDVRIAKELGAVGVLLASGVTKAADPAAVLRDLCSGA